MGTLVKMEPQSIVIIVAARERKMNRGGFSWKRLVGISAMKSKISRKIGIPLTRSGRQRKFGKWLGMR